MSSYEIVLALINGKNPSKIPVMPMTRLFSIKHYNYSFKEILDNPDSYVRCQSDALADFGYDAVWSNSIDVVAEAYGCKVKLYEDEQPSFVNSPITSKVAMERMGSLDLKSSHWANYTLSMVEKFKTLYKEKVPIISTVYPPTMTAFFLMGQNFYTSLVDEEYFIKTICHICLNSAVSYAKLTAEAGADLIFSPNAVASKNMISREHYLRFVHPVNKLFFNELKKYGVKVIYHACGDFSDRFDLVATEGADIIHLSNFSNISYNEIERQISDKSVIMGLVPAVDCMLKGSTENITAACHRDLEHFTKNSRFILSADCILPRDTPSDNLRAMVEAARGYANIN